jgi:Na+/H+ antiporter NhaD/arsenite permease-like protein
MDWWGALPFAGLLLCIAILPLIHKVEHLWHSHLFQLGIALLFGAPVMIWMLATGHQGEVLHSVIEYFQFISLLFSLFVISGGIFMGGDIQATPQNNTAFMAIGAVLASFIGTTGAAMFLIRPLLLTNQERAYRVHTVIFTILIIANCGGLLTPLGDPPLFLGMLRGVPFTWTFNLFPMWIFVNSLLLFAYYVLDKRMYAKEDPQNIASDTTILKPLSIEGRFNFLLLGGVILSVAFVPSIVLPHGEHARAVWYNFVPVREICLLTLALLSLVQTDPITRQKNGFVWHPIAEVAALFIGIFLAMIPALIYLRQVAPSLPIDEITLFVFTGGLSAFLDNAPTYVTFFEIAHTIGGEPSVAGVRETFLVAISLAAVFCGALTYIGNGPNFMVRSVAHYAHVHMPSFFGYMAWSLGFLGPILTAMVLIFLVQNQRISTLGIILTILLVLGWTAINLKYLIPRKAQTVVAPSFGGDDN